MVQIGLDIAYLGEIVSGQSRGFKRNLEKGQGILVIASEEMVESNQIIRSGEPPPLIRGNIPIFEMTINKMNINIFCQENHYTFAKRIF